MAYHVSAMIRGVVKVDTVTADVNDTVISFLYCRLVMGMTLPADFMRDVATTFAIKNISAKWQSTILTVISSL